MDSPIYDFQGLLEEYPFSDGFQYEHELDTIYYYDKISSRPFKFDYKEDASYKDTLKCRKYVLDTKDISININEKNDYNSKKAFISQKVNKPFIITGDGKNGLDKEIESEISKENYICVDVISNMVLDSKINLVYSIYTRDYGLINKKIESKKVLPVFTYYRNYEVDVDSYKENFPGVAGYYTFRTVFIIVGVILIVILFIIALVALKKMSRKINEEEIKENIAEQKLVPGDSRDPTIHG